MRPILLFDVNETLLDLRALDTLFEEKLGSAALRPLWFAQMLQLSFVGGLIDRYINFTDAQLAALEMIAERANVDISEADRTAIVNAMSDLPPHPEVPEALDPASGERLSHGHPHQFRRQRRRSSGSQCRNRSRIREGAER